MPVAPTVVREPTSHDSLSDRKRHLRLTVRSFSPLATEHVCPKCECLSQPVAFTHVRGGGSIPVVMAATINPRMARALRKLDKIAKIVDEMHTDLVELLREQGATWEDIGEAYDPPKSRQAVAKWVSTRRKRTG